MDKAPVWSGALQNPWNLQWYSPCNEASLFSFLSGFSPCWKCSDSCDDKTHLTTNFLTGKADVANLFWGGIYKIMCRTVGLALLNFDCLVEGRCYLVLSCSGPDRWSERQTRSLAFKTKESHGVSAISPCEPHHVSRASTCWLLTGHSKPRLLTGRNHCWTGNHLKLNSSVYDWRVVILLVVLAFAGNIFPG